MEAGAAARTVVGTGAPPALVVGADGLARCWWCGTDALYVRYHDDEWGRPVDGDERPADDVVFERLCLEGFQSGLAWITILRKREAFRRAFAGFSVEAVARFDQGDVERLVADASIVRHRGKIEAAIGNARAALDLIASEGSLASFVASFAPAPRPEPPRTPGDLPTQVPESVALSKALRARGFRFVGPTTMYAAMQALGLVDDHVAGCAFRRRP